MVDHLDDYTAGRLAVLETMLGVALRREFLGELPSKGEVSDYFDSIKKVGSAAFNAGFDEGFSNVFGNLYEKDS